MNKNFVTEEEKMQKLHTISIILFWGALWGVVEATVGYIIHALPFKMPTGSILFPIGYCFMQKSYKETKDLKSILYTSAIATSIKLINLFIPTVQIIKVLNPSAYILFEGLAVVFVFKIFEYNEEPIKFIHSLIMSLFWRIGYYVINFVIFIPLALVSSSSILNRTKFIEFFLINSFINSILIYFYSKFAAKNNKELKIKYNPAFSISLFIFALLIQWLV